MGLYYPGTANDNVDYYYTNSLVRAESEGVWGNPSDDSRSDTGWRFQNITIPQGATIGSAKITWTSSRNSSGTVVGSIQAEDADNPATFTAGGAGGVSDFNTRLANLTTASVSYSQGAVSADTTYDTPDIKDIVQEIVDRGSWASGNSMVFFLLMGATSDGVVRFWRGYSNGSAYPVLEITILSTYTLTCDAASFALTGNNINFKRGYVLVCAAGSFALTGIDALFKRGYGIICEVGSFILTGIDATLRYTGWTRRTKPSSSWSDRTKPTTTYTDRTKPTTNWLNR